MRITTRIAAIGASTRPAITAISTAADAKVASPTWLVASADAISTGSPAACLRLMFSTITTASSVHRLIARITARITSTFNEKPSASAIRNAGMIDAGIVTAGINVARQDPRKT